MAEKTYAFLYAHHSDHPDGGSIIVVGEKERAHRQACRLHIGKLEGVFVSRGPLEAIMPLVQGNPLCKRDEMPDFESKYNGKFVPFEHPDYK